MQVIQDSLDDLKRLEAQIKEVPENNLGIDDELFLKASIAQSKAIAGLALAIKESGRLDTFGLTLDEAELDTPKPLCPKCSFPLTCLNIDCDYSPE